MRNGNDDGLRTAMKQYKKVLKAISAVYSANDKMFE